MFRNVGEGAFPRAPEVPCEVWTWSPRRPGGDTGRMSVRFLCPKNEAGPRPFFLEPAVEAALARKANHDYLNPILKFGREILTEVEESTDVSERAAYDLALALFRRRNDRPFGIAREFGTARDVMYLATSGWRSVVPGFDPEDGTGNRIDSRQEAGRALEQSLASVRGADLALAPESGSSKPLVRILEVVRSGPPPAAPVVDHQFVVPTRFIPYTGPLDRLTVGGLEGRHSVPDLRRIVESVRSALIYVSEEIREAPPLPDELATNLVEALTRAAQQRKPAEFAAWLNEARSHGFIKQLGVKSVDSSRLALLARQARQLFADLLWFAYQLAARCYGAWQMVAYLDFATSSSIAADQNERSLFREMHARQLYLAGLPPCFLGRSPLRWVWQDLRELWAAGPQEPDRYDVITDRLRLFGEAVTNRRMADKPTLAETTSFDERCPPERSGEPISTSDEQNAEGRDELSVLSSITCPECGDLLQIIETRPLDDRGFCRVEVFCKQCDESRDYLIDPNAFVANP
jgi:hypothetical protein